MNDFTGVSIVAALEVPYTRHAPAGTSTAGLLAQALKAALLQAELSANEVDGLGVASFTLPDRKSVV